MFGLSGRLGVFGVLLLVLGVLLFVGSATRLYRAIRAKHTYGAPYRDGTASDRFVALLIVSPITLVGMTMFALALAQAGLQRVGGTVRVGQMEVGRPGWASTAVRILPDSDYPERRVLEGKVSGARWAIAGTFVTWAPGVRWLGLRNGHRVTQLVGTQNTTGMTGEEQLDTDVLDSLPLMTRGLVLVDPYVPFLTVYTAFSPWYSPTEKRSMVLHAYEAGYMAEDLQGEGGGN